MAGSNEGRNFSRYLDYMHAQVRELCERYGKLDLMWFDFSYDDMTGEKWRATELADMVRTLQPGIILNNRLEVSGEGMGSLAACEPTPFHGDFVTPERIIPPAGLFDAEGRPLAWEACITMNDNWGYVATDTNYKPADLIIRKLVECVSKGGNLILNVGPDARGALPPPERGDPRRDRRLDGPQRREHLRLRPGGGRPYRRRAPRGRAPHPQG